MQHEIYPETHCNRPLQYTNYDLTQTIRLRLMWPFEYCWINRCLNLSFLSFAFTCRIDFVHDYSTVPNIVSGDLFRTRFCKPIGGIFTRTSSIRQGKERERPGGGGMNDCVVLFALCRRLLCARGSVRVNRLMN